MSSRWGLLRLQWNSLIKVTTWSQGTFGISVDLMAKQGFGGKKMRFVVNYC